MNVLVIDDDPVNRKLLGVTLKVAGYDVCEAVDGVEGLEKLEKQPVDMIVSDILMPRKDGYQLCYELRKNDKFKALPIVLYSSTYTSPANEQLAIKFGADKFLRKPAPTDVLVKTLKDLIEQRASRRAAVTEAPPQALQETREYSTTLVKELEDQNTDLEKAREQIQETNKRLLERNQELETTQTELARLNFDLERRVQGRTAELEMANQELDAFCSAASHDLRAPVRAIQGYAQLLMEDAAAKLNPDESQMLARIREVANGMNGLIDSLLGLSRVSRSSFRYEAVDLTGIAGGIVQELQRHEPERRVEVSVKPGMVVCGDKALLTTALQNLLGNAWKYTSQTANARIDFSVVERNGQTSYFVRDTGAGFDMQHAAKLFQPFQRLHTAAEFPGSGIGLATVQRIIRRHGGKIWAESTVGQGATFYFTLPMAGAGWSLD